MTIEKITIFGTGNIGTHIAYYIAFKGFDVTLYDLNEELLEQARTRFRELAEHYEKNVNASQAENKAALSRLAYSTNIAEAVGNADFAIEAISEDLQIKKDFYKKLQKVAPEKTIFATSCSTLLPSNFAQDTGRPENFVGLHFQNKILKQPKVELISVPTINPETFETVANFLEEIGIVVIHHENNN